MTDLADKIVKIMIGLITVSVIGGALIPLALGYLVNLTAIGGVAATLFVAGGIVSILVVIALFRGVLKLIGGMGGGR